jgi:hypothetical protein
MHKLGHINVAHGSPKHKSGRNEHKIREWQLKIRIRSAPYSLNGHVQTLYKSHHFDLPLRQGKLTSQPEIANILNLEARNKGERLLEHENVTGQ